MSTESVVNQVNQEILELWKKEFGDQTDKVRCPLIYPVLPQDCILFVGCNPALPKRSHYSPPTLAQASNEPTIIAKLQKQEGEARKYYSYFRPCDDIAKQLELPWAHVDLFFQRGTKQKEIEEEISGVPIGWETLIELPRFFRGQIALSRKLIEACHPRLVLVANAFASKIFSAEFKLGQLDKDGLLWSNIGDKQVPTFLSGMLTGQRALDRGSFERLVWHMAMALRRNRL